MIALERSQRVRGDGRDPEAGTGVEEQPQHGLGNNSVSQERLARQSRRELKVRVIIGSVTTRYGLRYARICLHLAHQIVLRMHPGLAVSNAVARLGEKDPESHQEREQDGWKAGGSQVPHPAQT